MAILSCINRELRGKRKDVDFFQLNLSSIAVYEPFIFHIIYRKGIIKFLVLIMLFLQFGTTKGDEFVSYIFESNVNDTCW